MERCRCSKVIVMMQLITQRCSMSVQLSTLDRTLHTYYNKKYKEASVRKRYYECTISTTQSTRKYHSSENDTRRHLRIITKTNTKRRQKLNEKITLHYYRLLLTRHYDQRPFDETVCDAIIANGGVKNPSKR